MYGMVLMVAVSGSGDTAGFGNRSGGCGGYVAAPACSTCAPVTAAPAGCAGYSAGCRGGGGLFGGRSGGGLFHRHGCSGYGGCTGYAAPVVVNPCPAPVCNACPAPCAAPACNTGSGGMFRGLCKKKHACATPCATSYAPVYSAPYAIPYSAPYSYGAPYSMPYTYSAPISVPQAPCCGGTAAPIVIGSAPVTGNPPVVTVPPAVMPKITPPGK